MVVMFRKFYTTVVLNEIVCNWFFSRKRIVKNAKDNVPCHKCGTEMQAKQWKCCNGK